MASCEHPPPPDLIWVRVVEDDTGVRVGVEETPHATEFKAGLPGRWVPYVPLVSDDESQ